jgi:hypothetical protein
MENIINRSLMMKLETYFFSRKQKDGKKNKKMEKKTRRLTIVEMYTRKNEISM